jgi:hypothetical protein
MRYPYKAESSRSLGHLKTTSTMKSITPRNTPHMDSPVVAQLFRQLARHRACQTLKSQSTLPARIHDGRRTQRRCMSDRRGAGREEPSRNESHWQQRTELFPLDMRDEYSRYPMVTADQLRSRRERPKRVKMLTRDFIEGE